jgi:hypothetical protein
MLWRIQTTPLSAEKKARIMPATATNRSDLDGCTSELVDAASDDVRQRQARAFGGFISEALRSSDARARRMGRGGESGCSRSSFCRCRSRWLTVTSKEREAS